ncbi:MAG: hypothetical protein JSS20_01055 [Proteobacteria bacterium]|nr:hypothetical protein [Pseudomonadota bacterium]
MVTIQSGMLIALGFLAASLLGLLIAPAFWRRAVRLTSRRLKETIPLTEMEIEADRDRIRAEYAIKMHKLEALVEQVKLAGARQQIEINRRDAHVNMLEADLEKLRASYEEAQNARRVLEQTIGDRLPRIETRLSEARQVLNSRDREVAKLTETTQAQVKALADASAINAQQQEEIERLSGSLARRGRSKADAQAARDSDAAMRAELDGLRSKAREQAALLARLQSFAGRGGSDGEPVGGGNGADSAQLGELEKQIRALRAKNDDQAGEIARLKAAIAVFEQEPAERDGKGAGRENRIAMRAKLQSLEAHSAQQGETILKLRSELAAANERMARQAQHFTSELKRLGPSTAGRRRTTAGSGGRSSLAERVAQAKSTAVVAPVEAAVPVALAEQSVDAPETPKGDVAPSSPSENRGNGAPQLAVVETEPGASNGGPAGSEDGSAKAARGSGRPRLLDRIAGMSRGS